MRYYHCSKCNSAHWEDEALFTLHSSFVDRRGVLIATLAERERMRENGTA